MVVLRAACDSGPGIDLGTASPLAAALDDGKLRSRCAACFGQLDQSEELVQICHGPCKGRISYCCLHCYDSDVGIHTSSGECNLLSQLPPPQGSCLIRVALRWVALIGGAAIRVSDSRDSRISGLLSNRRSLLEDEEFELQVKEAGRLMLLARGAKRMQRDLDGKDEEEIALLESAACVVITNGVQVELDEGIPPVKVQLGTALYEPAFSWFNHSCRPNACYRFVPYVDQRNLQQEQRITADDYGQEEVLWKQFSRSPRVIVRSLRAIARGEEVTITYTDLLQPKSLRQWELWKKYRFSCACSRCRELPFSYSDGALDAIGRCKCSATLVARERGGCCPRCGDCDPEAVLLIKALVSETEAASEAFLIDDDPYRCSRLIERALSKVLLGNGDISPHLITNSACLTAFITLRSAYRVLAGDVGAAAGCSVLVAGIVQHIYNSGECGLAVVLGYLWLEAGLDLLQLSPEPSDKVVMLAMNTIEHIFLHFPAKLWDRFPETSSGNQLFLSARRCFCLSHFMSQLSFGQFHPLAKYVKSQLDALL